MKIKTFVINLKESDDRRKYVMAETAKYPCLDVELVNAVYGKKLSVEETECLFDCKQFKRRNLRDPMLTEIGCTLSHRECYRRLLMSKEKCALILEDDVCFLDSTHMELVLSEVVKRIAKEKDACIVTLARHSHYYPHTLYEVDNYSLYRIWRAFSTCAYLINRQAAHILLATPKASIFADDYEYMNERGILVEGIYPTFVVGKSDNGEIESEVASASEYPVDSIDSPLIDRFCYLLRNRKRSLLRVIGVLRLRKTEKGVNL